MREVVQKCDCCGKNKEKTKPKKMMYHIKTICPSCAEELALTTKCLEVGTDWLVSKRPEHYVKISRFVVTSLDSTS